MANINLKQMFAASPMPAQAPDMYAVADQQKAIAEELRKRAMQGGRFQGMLNTGQTLGIGLSQLGEALLARKAAKDAQATQAGADAKMRDATSQGIEKLAGAYQIGDVAGEGATPLLGGSLPGSKIETALAGTDPRKANEVVAEALLRKSMPVQLDPDKAAQRELMREQQKAAQEQFKLTLEQRAREAEQRAADAAATREQRAEAARQANEIRLQLGQMAADSARYAADARKDAALAKIETDKKNAPNATSPEAAAGFLQNAGYDPVTKEDDITKLLKVATGGLLERGRDAGARMFNKTTEGAKASAALKSRASEAVLDFLGGKLGAGVSNADRDFMMQRAGDVGNEKLSTGEREAAWLDVRHRMERAAGGGQPAPEAPPTAASAPKSFATEADAVKAGVKPGDKVVIGGVSGTWQ